MPQIEVAFDIDASGIVKVSAKDLGTGKEQKITITATSNLSKEDIKQKVKEAENFAEEDVRKREVAETKNEAEQTAYQYRKILDELREKIPADKASEVDKAIEDLEEAVGKDDYELMSTRLAELKKVFSDVSQKMYANIAQEQAQQAGGPEVGATDGGGEPSGGAPADAVDADYTILEDE